MGLQEDIIEAFFVKLSEIEEVSKQDIEKLKELFDSKNISDESFRSFSKMGG